jgi:hypothetical protein
MVYRSLLFSLLAIHCSAATWYAAPNGNTDGDGSITHPWPLFSALTSESIQPGDTLYLRGGRYEGPGFLSTLTGELGNYITVASHPGEWAVVTDGLNLYLGQDLPSAPYNTTHTAVPVFGTESFPNAGWAIRIGNEISYMYGKTGTNRWQIDRRYNIEDHSTGAVVAVEANYIQQSGSYVIFRDFEITSTHLTNRVVSTSQSGNADRAGLNLSPTGAGNKAVNLIIHNVGHPAIGFWNQGNGGEINGCIVWGCGMYDGPTNGTHVIRGAGVYAQNHTGDVWLKNNIYVRQLTEAMQGYGTTAHVNGFHFVNNITAMSANRIGIAVWADTGKMTNNAVVSNWFGFDSVRFGYESQSNRLAEASRNMVVLPGVPFNLTHQLSARATNNTIFYDSSYDFGGNGVAHYRAAEAPVEVLDVLWDGNQYYMTGAMSQPFTYTTSATNGAFTWSEWREISGFDSASTFQFGWPMVTRVEAIPLDYNSNRWHVAVVNTAATNATALDLGTLGFQAGQAWTLRDAQNYFTVVASNVYTGGAITLPLDLTAVSEIPGVTNFANLHTNVEEPGLFNAFVLDRVAASTPAQPGGTLRANKLVVR